MITLRDYSTPTASAEMLGKLMEKAEELKKVVNGNKIEPDVFVWIKEYAKTFYFKIEFDVNHQELQYDLMMNDAGKLYLNEIHFKTFVKGRYRYERVDLTKEQACPTLRAIDDLLAPLLS